MALKAMGKFSLRYEFQGYNRVRNSLRKLATEYREETDDTLKDWTKLQRGDLKAFGYPPQSNAPQPFKTERQRRWFFWALSEGVIQVPYHRLGTLANSWRVKQEGWSHWVLENSAPYAALVVGRGRQAKYHESTWWEAETMIEANTGDLTEQLTDKLIGLTE